MGQEELELKLSLRDTWTFTVALLLAGWMLFIPVCWVQAAKLSLGLGPTLAYIVGPVLLWVMTVRTFRRTVKSQLFIPAYIHAVVVLCYITFVLRVSSRTPASWTAFMHTITPAALLSMYWALQSDPGRIPQGQPPPGGYQAGEGAAQGEPGSEDSSRGDTAQQQQQQRVQVLVGDAQSNETEQGLRHRQMKDASDGVGCVPLPSHTRSESVPLLATSLHPELTEESGTANAKVSEPVLNPDAALGMPQPSPAGDGALALVVQRRRERMPEEEQQQQQSQYQQENLEQQTGQAQQQQQHWQQQPYSPHVDWSVYFCYECHIWRPARSRHCFKCGRCIDKYDHHCPAIRNCVGRRNHRIFFLALAIYAAGEFAFAHCCYIYLKSLGLFSVDPSTMLSTSASPVGLHAAELSLRGFSQALFSEPWVTLLMFFSYVQVAWQVPLLIFHAYLVSRNLTTYEWARWHKVPGLFIYTVQPYNFAPLDDGHSIKSFVNPYYRNILSHWISFLLGYEDPQTGPLQTPP